MLQEWPFKLNLNELLKQLETDWSEGLATYVTWKLAGQELHAIGLASNWVGHSRDLGWLRILTFLGPKFDRGNKKRRKVAALLALTLRCLMASGTKERWLQAELEQAKAAPLQHVTPEMRAVARQRVPRQPSAHSEPVWPSSGWVPESGSWIWWLSNNTLAVLCEDVGAQVFQQARDWFFQAANVDKVPEDQELSPELSKWMQKVFPNIFFTNRYTCQDYTVVGVGRDLEHRRRAGCLGLAALMSQQARKLTDMQQKVVKEVYENSRWLPMGPLRRFYNLETQGFWQNMEIWGASEEQEVSKRALSDIKMNAQPALLKALQEHRQELSGYRKGYVELDLTNSSRPWRKIIQNHRERAVMERDIKRFIIAVDEEKIDPYQEWI